MQATTTTHHRAIRGSAARWIAAAGLTALIAAWAWAQMGRALEAWRWAATRAAGPREIVALDPARLPRDPDALITYGRAVGREIFPPNHEGAAAEFRRAIALDPMNARAWFELAKEETLLGRTDVARKALTRSDELDPHYPRQRFGAIQLWETLGDRSRAIGLARKLAALGGEFNDRAATALEDLGLEPERIFATLEFEKLSGAELTAALGTLRVESPEHMAALWRRVDLSRLDTPERRLRAVRLAVDPFVYEPAIAIWKLQDPALEMTPGGYPVDNPNLARSPALEPFWFGWQPLPGDSKTPARWVAPAAGSIFPKGYIQIAFHDDSPARSLSWMFYRLPVPDLTEMEIEVDVRLRPPAASRCDVSLDLGRERIDSAATSWGEEGWQTLTLSVPAQAAGGAAELWLTRRMRSEAEMADPAEIHIGGVRFKIMSISTAGDGA